MSPRMIVKGCFPYGHFIIDPSFFLQFTIGKLKVASIAPAKHHYHDKIAMRKPRAFRAMPQPVARFAGVLMVVDVAGQADELNDAQLDQVAGGGFGDGSVQPILIGLLVPAIQVQIVGRKGGKQPTE